MNAQDFFSILCIGMTFGIIIGFVLGGYISTRDRQLELDSSFYNGYNLGWDECKDRWIEHELGVPSCWYELNNNKTMGRYSCGELSTMWEEIENNKYTKEIENGI